MSSRPGPVSIDELLAKQRKEKEDSAKPKFLTKAERAAIALAKRAAEVEAAKDKEVATLSKRDELNRKARSEGAQYSQQNGNYDQNGYANSNGLDYGRGDPSRRGGSDFGRNDRGGAYGSGARGRGGPRGRGGLGYSNQRGGGRGGYDNRGYDRRDDRQPQPDERPPPSAPAAMRSTPSSAMQVDPPADSKPNGAPSTFATPAEGGSPIPAIETTAPPPPGLPQDAPPPPPDTQDPTPPTDEPPPPPPADLPPPPPARSPTPPPPQSSARLTLAEMAALSASNAPSSSSNLAAPLNAQLNATRYLGQRAPDKRKIRKQSDKKFNFDWDRQDDTGLDEVDPIYAPYIPPAASTKGDKGDRKESHSGYGPKAKAAPIVQAVQGKERRLGMFGRGVLAGFDRDGGMLDKKAKGAIDERHWTDKTLEEMRDRDWRIFREDFSIAARGGHIPLPLRSWKESNIPQQILDAIDEVGYTEPSPIQRQAIPIGLQNRDQIGIAETGSGKTAAFVVPMLAYISRLPPLSDENRGHGPFALVLAPTRELAQQIESETNKFCKLLGYTCVSIVGGRAIEEQQFNMRFGAEIVIATPGRLKDCIERHVLVLSQCTYVVMDEADRMVSLGFEEQINYILDSMPLTNIKPDTAEAEDGELMSMVIQPPEGQENLNSTLALYRQTVMFSATMPPAVERLAKKYLRRPAIVTIGVAGQAVDTVDQQVEFITTDDKKKSRLLDILNNGGFEPPMIIFVNQKKTADGLMKDIQRAHWNATTLHSGKNQEQREAALNSIRTGECQILVATDLAGRGIDVPDVSLVVNFQMSNTIEAYIHRIGRTGRAGKTGTAITFLNDGDEELMYDLKSEISKSPVSRCPPELLKHPAAQTKMSGAMKRARADIED